MKIAYVLPGLDQKGGIQEFAHSISTNIGAKYDIDYFDYQYNFFDVLNRYLLKLPSKLGSFIFHYFLSFYFRKQYQFKEYSLIHFWHIDAAMAFVDKNYIVTCHGLEILPCNVPKYKKIMYKKALEKAKIITANSHFTKQLIISEFQIPDKNIVIITPGVNVKKFDRPSISQNKIIIGSLARFVERKNFVNIIKALQILDETMNLNFSFYIAGAGPEKEKILRQLKNVSFEWKYFGEISEKDKIEKFYPSLDIFVLPTLSLENSIEGFGIVYLEANSAGVPVIASSVGGVPDAIEVGKSGIMCNPKDPKDIANKINYLLKNKKSFQPHVKQWALKHDISVIKEQFQNIYSSI